MTRLDLDPNNFAGQVQALQADLLALKTAQRSGKDIWKPHIVECLDGAGNPTLYDLVAPWDGIVGDNASRNFIATMTADHQDDVFAIPLFKVYYGAPGVLPPASNYIAGNNYLAFAPLPPKKIAYAGHFGTNFYPDNNNAYLKVFFYATDTGTLSVVGNP
jgi:hypothetical protein